MPLVDPLSDITDPEVKQLVDFFNETLGFCPNSVLTMQRRPNIARAFMKIYKALSKKGIYHRSP